MSDQLPPLIWKTETRRLKDLIKWEHNPRYLTEDQAKRLKASIEQFGYSQLLEIEPDNMIVDGHQRDDVLLMMEKYGGEYKLEVRVSNRKLTLQERKDYIASKHQGATGSWDVDKMLNLYDGDELLAHGFEISKLMSFGFVFDEMNDTDEKEIPDIYGIFIDCDDEMQQKKLLTEFSKKGLRCRALI